MAIIKYWSVTACLFFIGLMYFVAVSVVVLIGGFAYLVAWLIVVPIAVCMRLAGHIGEQLQSFR